MIKLELRENPNFEEIKKNHIEYFKAAVEKELSNLHVDGGLYVKKRKKNNSQDYITYYKLDEDERGEIEKLFCGTFSFENSKCIFKINSDEKIEFISVGKLEKIISIFEKVEIKKELMERIFNYDRFVKNNGWNRHRLITLLGVKVCPYCNRQYVTSYKSEDGGGMKTTADLDHFYWKSEYPYLSLSLYNFIPSCQICNSRFKKEIDFRKNPHIYPYERGFSDDAKFRTRSDKIDYLLGNSNDFDIYMDIKKSIDEVKIINSTKTFKIDEVYKIHTEYVQEIIKKSIMYSKDKVEEITSEFPGLFSSREEIYRIIFGNYIVEEQLGNRPLAKLTKDICEELGVKFK